MVLEVVFYSQDQSVIGLIGKELMEYTSFKPFYSPCRA